MVMEETAVVEQGRTGNGGNGGNTGNGGNGGNAGTQTAGTVTANGNVGNANTSGGGTAETCHDNHELIVFTVCNALIASGAFPAFHGDTCAGSALQPVVVVVKEATQPLGGSGGASGLAVQVALVTVVPVEPL